jgi:Uri superfamily endonuclease
MNRLAPVRIDGTDPEFVFRAVIIALTLPCTRTEESLLLPTHRTMNPCPATHGPYILLLACSSTRAVRIGRLGTIRLRRRHDVNVDTAFGPDGLRARIAHHRHKAARPHWHIDYLRGYAKLECVMHEWAAIIAAMSGGVEGAVRFRSSGCEDSRIDQPRLLGTRSTTTPQTVRMRTMSERRFSIFRPPLSCKRIRRKPHGRKFFCPPVCIYWLQRVKSMGPRCRLTMRSRLDG